MSDSGTQRADRRPFQFYLWHLFALVLVVALLLSSCLTYRRWQSYVRKRCRQQIETRIDTFNRALTNSDYDGAFEVMSPAYRESHSVSAFKSDFAGRIDLESGWLLSFRGGTAWIYPYRAGYFELLNGPEYEMEQIDDEWYLTGAVEWYLD